jgi:hypothetical protein
MVPHRLAKEALHRIIENVEFNYLNILPMTISKNYLKLVIRDKIMVFQKLKGYTSYFFKF